MAVQSAEDPWEARNRLRREYESCNERLLELVMNNWIGKHLLARGTTTRVCVIGALRTGRQPYDENDPATTTDAVDERTHREHRDDPPDLTRRTFNGSFTRLQAALKPVADEELSADNRWP